MPKQWRYEPRDNRTPLNDPVIGHLEYGRVYDNPECANRPDFVEVKPKAKAQSRPKAAKTAKIAATTSVAPPSVAAAPTGTAGDTKTVKPPAEPADAGQPKKTTTS
jgi:hypothetical protein